MSREEAAEVLGISARTASTYWAHAAGGFFAKSRRSKGPLTFPLAGYSRLQPVGISFSSSPFPSRNFNLHICDRNSALVGDAAIKLIHRMKNPKS